MGLLDWLFGKKDLPVETDEEFIAKLREQRSQKTVEPFQYSAPKIRKLEGDGSYDFDIVGESYYQDALAAIAGPKTEGGVEHVCTARLVPEPSNPHDPNAVAVHIGGRKVGHLSRLAAAHWVGMLSRTGSAGVTLEADAMIIGGWKRPNGDEGHYGVKLDIG
ncbi:HIRAN domain-containing protein [Paenirhodobacter populi]|uniref:HIRAN domain-containing protein n=1 Tax=Paenirhodobacter populi TaxID=2306993 RepID=UPI0013E3DDD2|nr:HIRAN domain-containing protein [Sinirhodobacter populi]